MGENLKNPLILVNGKRRISWTIPMKKRVFASMIMVFALTSVAVLGAWAQAPSMVGVKVGDNSTYSFYVLWSSTNSSLVVPQEISDWNKTISTSLNVTDVGSTMVYVDITETMNDGTNTSSQGFVSVNSGLGVGAQLFVIGANLTAGEKAYPGSTADAVEAGAAAESFTIDETVSRTYLGASKTVNHYSERVTNATTGNYVDRNAYYDKETGILLEMTLEHFYADTDETLSQHWKIVQFNSAVAPSDETDETDATDASSSLPTWFVPAVIVTLIVVVAVFAVVVVLRRRSKGRAQIPRQALPQTPRSLT